MFPATLGTPGQGNTAVQKRVKQSREPEPEGPTLLQAPLGPSKTNFPSMRHARQGPRTSTGPRALSVRRKGKAGSREN